MPKAKKRFWWRNGTVPTESAALPPFPFPASKTPNVMVDTALSHLPHDSASCWGMAMAAGVARARRLEGRSVLGALAAVLVVSQPPTIPRYRQLVPTSSQNHKLFFWLAKIQEKVA